MTYRVLFRQIMAYGSFDRLPVIHWAEWPETRERWCSEGLPRGADVYRFLNATPHWRFIGPSFGWVGGRAPYPRVRDANTR